MMNIFTFVGFRGAIAPIALPGSAPAKVMILLGFFLFDSVDC